MTKVTIYSKLFVIHLFITYPFVCSFFNTYAFLHYVVFLIQYLLTHYVFVIFYDSWRHQVIMVDKKTQMPIKNKKLL